MFVLFQDGKEVGHFNPIPEYWEELPPGEKAKWKGGASFVAELIPSISSNAIEEYFAEWDLEDEDPSKANPEDEFTSGDCWQMCDFMKKDGLEYPLGEDGPIRRRLDPR